MGRSRVRVCVLAMLILCAWVTGAGKGQEDAEAEAVRLATRTLGEHLGIDEPSITVVEVVAVDWRDSSLGCPEPGRTYAPLVMSGYRVTLSVVGVDADPSSYRVHVAGTRAVVCEPSAAAANPSSPREARVLQQAREHLAARLDVDQASIRVAAMEPRAWTDAGLGCPEPGRLYAAVLTDGFLIELEAGGRTYRYHTDQRRVRLCEDRP